MSWRKNVIQWQRAEGDDPILHVGGGRSKDQGAGLWELLPEPIRRFTTKGVYDEEHQHLSLPGRRPWRFSSAPGPEFSSIVEGPSFLDVYQSQLTCAGLCAHDSAMNA
jgi:hypothetical protein